MLSMLSRFAKDEEATVSVEYAIFLAFCGFLLITVVVAAWPDFAGGKDATEKGLKKLQGVE